ncbi:putative zinc metalloprotease EGY2, chloroplastic, partial [Mucuna pruriens]
NKMPGNTRMDAALDAMHQFGFATQLIRNTVKELLHVYDGVQGWPFIEEASYKLLIETLLGKQGSSEEDKDGVNETQSTGVFEVGSSNLVAQDTLLHSRDDLDFSFKTNGEDYASHVNLGTNIRDSAVQADRGRHERSIMVESKNELEPVDNVKGSNASTFVNNKVESTLDKTPMVQSSEAFHHFPLFKRKGCLGWIGNGSDDGGEHIHFPIPQLSKQIEKMIEQGEPPQSGSRRRRKSRWDRIICSPLLPLLLLLHRFLQSFIRFNGARVSSQLEAPLAPNGNMNLSLAAPSAFRGNLLVPLSRCTSCFEFDLRFQHSGGFRHSRCRWSSFKLIRNPRRRGIACSVTEPHNGNDEKEKEADKNGETQPLEVSSEQSVPPSVDAEQLNEFSNETKEQNDVQDMDSKEVASGSPLPGVKPQKLDEAIKIPKETIEILKNQVFGFDTFFVTSQDPYEGGVLFKGNLRGQAAKSYEKLSKRLKDKFGDEYKLFLLVNPEDDKPVAVVVPRTTLQPETTAVPEWFAAASFGLVTAFTLLLRNVPALQSNLLSTFDNLNLLKDGLPGALVTALILGVHELGHFLAAQNTGVKLGVPYFVPSWQIGSFGAITRIRNIVSNREDLLKVAAAGPIAGYSLGLLLLLLGFVLPPSDGIGVVVDASVFHESFLAGGIAKLLLGNVLKEGTAISINPLVIWAWAGLLINAINSIPAGELDGGRISFALWGRKASLRFTGVSVTLLGFSSLLNDVAFYWVVLVFFLQRGPIAPLSEEITDPDEKYVAIGVIVLLLGLLYSD